MNERKPVAIAPSLQRPDGTPATYAESLMHAVGRIREASAKGQTIRLTRDEVRALDWSVIREDGGEETAGWREGSFESMQQETK